MLMPADAVSSMLSDKRALKIFPKKRKYECVEEPQDQEDLPDPSPLPGPSNAHDLPSQSVNMLVDLRCLDSLVSNQRCKKCGKKVGPSQFLWCVCVCVRGTE